MEDILLFFENIPTWFRLSILLGGIVFFWVIEGLIPLFPSKYDRFKHGKLNLLITVFNLAIGLGFAGLLLKTSLYVAEHKIGLLQWIKAPIWLEIIVGVLLLDFIGAWFVHWVEHRVKWMWKFHVVHHSDRNVDVTTGLRHHPGEFIFRMTFTVLGVFVSGASISIIMIYQSLSALFTHITHANINLGIVDRVLSSLFVTPNMHKMHHHYKLPLTDRNFGNIFSIWDRLFGTFASQKNVGKLIYGIDTHMDPSENEELGTILKIPFQKYRTPTPPEEL